MLTTDSQLSGLAIGNGTCTRSQVAKEAKVTELWAMNESRGKVRRQILRARDVDNVSLSHGPLISLDTNYKLD